MKAIGKVVFELRYLVPRISNILLQADSRPTFLNHKPF